VQGEGGSRVGGKGQRSGQATLAECCVLLSQTRWLGSFCSARTEIVGRRGKTLAVIPGPWQFCNSSGQWQVVPFRAAAQGSEPQSPGALMAGAVFRLLASGVRAWGHCCDRV
jgi:hypothetical protein